VLAGRLELKKTPLVTLSGGNVDAAKFVAMAM
jgi:hypothetical protein